MVSVYKASRFLSREILRVCFCYCRNNIGKTGPFRPGSLYKTENCDSGRCTSRASREVNNCSIHSVPIDLLLVAIERVAFIIFTLWFVSPLIAASVVRDFATENRLVFRAFLKRAKMITKDDLCFQFAAIDHVRKKKKRKHIYLLLTLQSIVARSSSCSIAPRETSFTAKLRLYTKKWILDANKADPIVLWARVCLHLGPLSKAFCLPRGSRYLSCDHIQAHFTRPWRVFSRFMRLSHECFPKKIMVPKKRLGIGRIKFPKPQK